MRLASRLRRGALLSGRRPWVLPPSGCGSAILLLSGALFKHGHGRELLAFQELKEGAAARGDVRHLVGIAQLFHSCGAVAEDSAKTAQWAVFSSAARAIHPRPPRTPVSNGYRSFCFIALTKGKQGWIRTAAEPTAACGGNREARLGQRSAFSKPCQGAAEKAASATRKTRRIVRRVKKPLCNSDDRCQRQKQGGAVGAAASRMRVPPKARCSRWEPRPGLLIQCGSRHPPAHILHLSLTCDTIQVTETTQTEDFFHDLRYPEQPAQLSGRKR